MRQKLGLFLLGLVALYWVAVPLMPFLDVPYKLALIPALIVAGEILTVIAIAILGREYWGSIKKGFYRMFRCGRTNVNKRGSA